MARTATLVLPLNVQAVKAAKAKDGKLTEYQVANERGLKLVVLPSGTGTYVLRYDVGTTGKRMQRKLKIGRRDAMTVHEARKKADDLRRQVEGGSDPVVTFEARRNALTFRLLAEERFTRDPDLADSTKKLYREALALDVYLAIGDLPAHEVTASHIVAILDKIEERGALVQADRTKAAIAGVFAWGRKRCLVASNPTAGLGRRSPATARERVLSDNELAAFWRAFQSDEAWLSPAMRHILRLAVLTGQRRSEVAGARVSELKLGGRTPTWTIAGDSRRLGRVVRGRTKNRREQALPLSRQAAELFGEAIALAHGSPCVFPANLDMVQPSSKTRLPHIHGESVSKAVRRLRVRFQIEDVTIHDMRRGISTWLGEQGVRPDVIDRILNHRPRDVTRLHYNFAGMDGLLRSALQMWADHVSRIVGEANPS
jgi:integrase